MVMHEWCMAHPWMTFIIALYALSVLGAAFGCCVSLIRVNIKREEDEKDGETDSSNDR